MEDTLHDINNPLAVDIKAGDKKAFTRLYNQYADQLYHTAYNILRNREVCEDVVQEVFIKLWDKHQTLEIRHIKAYLYAAVRNGVLMVIRNGKVNVSVAELEALAGPDSPLDHVLQKELIHSLEREISTLPKKCREIFCLSRKEGLSNKEIADSLKISVKTVENQLTIALRRLRAGLGEYLWAVVMLLKII